MQTFNTDKFIAYVWQQTEEAEKASEVSLKQPHIATERAFLALRA
jgi:hypothetical protein